MNKASSLYIGLIAPKLSTQYGSFVRIADQHGLRTPPKKIEARCKTSLGVPLRASRHRLKPNSDLNEAIF